MGRDIMPRSKLWQLICSCNHLEKGHKYVWVWAIQASTFKMNFMERCWGLAHDFSMWCLCESPSPFHACRESRQAGKVGGWATLFLRVSGARWQLLCEAWGCCCSSTAQHNHSHILEDSLRASCMFRASNWSSPKQRTVYSDCLLLLIFAELVWGDTGWERDMTHSLFNSLKSIKSDGCFLLGSNCDYTGQMAWTLECHVVLNHTQVVEKCI